MGVRLVADWCVSLSACSFLSALHRYRYHDLFLVSPLAQHGMSSSDNSRWQVEMTEQSPGLVLSAMLRPLPICLLSISSIHPYPCAIHAMQRHAMQPQHLLTRSLPTGLTTAASSTSPPRLSTSCLWLSRLPLPCKKRPSPLAPRSSLHLRRYYTEGKRKTDDREDELTDISMQAHDWRHAPGPRESPLVRAQGRLGARDVHCHQASRVGQFPSFPGREPGSVRLVKME